MIADAFTARNFQNVFIRQYNVLSAVLFAYLGRASSVCSLLRD
jgi:hypothetical protein